MTVPDAFDFSAFPDEDPQAIHGLGRHRWFAAMARTYWDEGDRRYFDGLMAQWDFYAARVPDPDEALMDGMHALRPLGRVAIVDPGRWLYRQDRDRNWVMRCQSHNTVVIEDAPVRAGEPIEQRALEVIAETSDTRVGRVTAEAMEGALVLSTSFAGYRADGGARVRRLVAMGRGVAAWLAVADGIEAPVAHVWTNAWLFPSAQPLEAHEDGTRTARLANGLVVRVAFASEGPLEVRDEAMFWCPNYGEKEPARWVRFSGRCRTDRRAFLFSVGEGDAPLPAAAWSGDALVVRVGDETHRLSTREATHVFLHAEAAGHTPIPGAHT